MRIITAIILLLSYHSVAIAQENISGKIIDATTKQAIPYVNIGIQALNIGTVSNGEGIYELPLSNPKDMVTFSSIGYETKTIKGSDLSQNGTIELTVKDYGMPIVEVKAERLSEERIYGQKNKTRGHSIGFGSRQLGTEMGALIRIKKRTHIKNVNFVINHAKGDSLFFRVNIYEYRKKKIGENILKENILIIGKQKKGTLTVDMTSYDLVLDGDVLLSLEWIKNDGEKGHKGLTFDTKKSRKLGGVHMKETSIGYFKKLGYKPLMTPCFYFIGNEVISK